MQILKRAFSDKTIRCDVCECVFVFERGDTITKKYSEFPSAPALFYYVVCPQTGCGNEILVKTYSPLSRQYRDSDNLLSHEEA